MASTNRYKDTPTYADASPGDLVQYGPFVPPTELDDISAASYAVHVVKAEEVGFFDLIANRYFGTGSETLWWMVTYVNGILDPEFDTQAGDAIRVPPRDVVTSIASRGGVSNGG